MPYAEFRKWCIYDYELDPGEPWRGDAQAALIAQTYHNMNVKRHQMKPLSAFLLKFGPSADDIRDKSKPAWKHVKDKMTNIFRSLGVNIIDKRKKKNAST